MKFLSYCGVAALFVLSEASSLAGITLLDGSTQWYFTGGGASGSGSMTDNTSTGTVAWTPDSSQNTMIWAYLGSTQTLAVGDSLSFTFTLTTGSTASFNSGTLLRLGLFNSNGSSPYTPTSNQYGSIANAAWLNDSGYGTTVDVGSTDTGSASQTKVRLSTASNTTLWAGAAFSNVGSTGSDADLAKSTVYSGSYVLTRESNGMQISMTLGGMTYTVLDTTASTTSFDTVSLFSGGAADSYTLSNMLISYQAVPEPSVIMLLSAGLLLGLVRYRAIKAART